MVDHRIPKTGERTVIHPAYGLGEVLFMQDGIAYARFPNPPGHVKKGPGVDRGVIPYAWVRLEGEHENTDI